MRSVTTYKIERTSRRHGLINNNKPITFHRAAMGLKNILMDATNRQVDDIEIEIKCTKHIQGNKL